MIFLDARKWKKKYLSISYGEHEIASYPCPLRWHLVLVHCWKYFVSIFPEANIPLCSRTERGLFPSYFLHYTEVVSCTELMPMKQANDFRFQSKLRIYPSHFCRESYHSALSGNLFYTSHPSEHKPFFSGLCWYKSSLWQSPQSKKA